MNDGRQLINLGILAGLTIALLVVALARRAASPRMTRLQMALALAVVFWIIVSYTLIVLDVQPFAFYSLLPAGTHLLAWMAVVIAPVLEPQLDAANKRGRE